MKTFWLSRSIFCLFIACNLLLVLSFPTHAQMLVNRDWYGNATPVPVPEDQDGTWRELETFDFNARFQMQSLLRDTTEKSDLALAKFIIDKTIDRNTDGDAGMRQIAFMVTQIQLMLPQNPTDRDTLNAMQKYVYTPGTWNNYKPFSYDFDDPLGHNIKNKLLGTYLKTRKGNCVSMPALYVILGQRLGLDVTLSTAPNHNLMIFTDRQTGEVINIETTSGGGPTRRAWYQHEFPSMTDEAINNGLYLRKLTKVETVAVMANTVGEDLLERKLYRKTILLGETLLKYNPKDVGTLMRSGLAFAALADQKYPYVYVDGVRQKDAIAKLNAEQKQDLLYLEHGNREYFEKLIKWGWKPETPEQKQTAIDQTNAAKSQPKLKQQYTAG